MTDLTETPVKKRVGRPAKYDWEAILDGQERFLHADHITTTVENFRSLAHMTAKRKSKSVSTRVADGGIYLKAIDRFEEPKETGTGDGDFSY